MGKTLYFSFFGRVEAPEGAEVQRFREDIAHLREEWKKRIERRIRNRRPIWEQDGDGLYARAYRTRRRGVALLVVECPAGGWAEAAEVFWPLRFREPAAIAGACCAPRYGLSWQQPAGEIVRPGAEEG
jgi:DNA-binding IclR family transcriptional regulator